MNDNSNEIPELQHMCNQQGLVVCHLNIRGLLNNIDKLEVILSNHNIKIFCITKTHLSSDILDAEIKIHG